MPPRLESFRHKEKSFCRFAPPALTPRHSIRNPAVVDNVRMSLLLYETVTGGKVSPDGTTLYAAGYCPVLPPSEARASGDRNDAGASSVVPSATVWRHEMTPSERRIFAALVSRMDAFQGKRATKVTAL